MGRKTKLRLKVIEWSLQVLIHQGEQIMETQAELAAKIMTLTDQVSKIGGETSKSLQMIKALQDQIAAGAALPELSAAVDKLAAQLQTVDDIVPDAPTP